MRFWAALVVSSYLVVASTASVGPDGTVLVLSQSTSTLTAIDSATGKVSGQLQLPAGAANLAVSPDAATAFIAHSDRGKISIVDLKAWTVVREIPAPGSPFGLAVSSSGRVYVGDWNSDCVHEIDAGTGKTLHTVTVGKAPAHLALTPDGERLLAVAREADKVAVVDTRTFTSVASLKVERAPFAVAVSPDASHAVVANAQAGSVSTIDLVALKVTAVRRVGAMPYGLAFDPANASVLVTNQQGGTVSVLTAAAATNVKVGSYPEGIALDGEGRAYVANWFSDDVSIIERGSHHVSAHLKVPGGPRSVAFVAGAFGR